MVELPFQAILGFALLALLVAAVFAMMFARRHRGDRQSADSSYGGSCEGFALGGGGGDCASDGGGCGGGDG